MRKLRFWTLIVLGLCIVDFVHARSSLHCDMGERIFKTMDSGSDIEKREMLHYLNRIIYPSPGGKKIDGENIWDHFVDIERYIESGKIAEMYEKYNNKTLFADLLGFYRSVGLVEKRDGVYKTQKLKEYLTKQGVNSKYIDNQIKQVNNLALAYNKLDLTSASIRYQNGEQLKTALEKVKQSFSNMKNAGDFKDANSIALYLERYVKENKIDPQDEIKLKRLLRYYTSVEKRRGSGELDQLIRNDVGKFTNVIEKYQELEKHVFEDLQIGDINEIDDVIEISYKLHPQRKKSIENAKKLNQISSTTKKNGQTSYYDNGLVKSLENDAVKVEIDPKAYDSLYSYRSVEKRFENTQKSLHADHSVEVSDKDVLQAQQYFHEWVDDMLNHPESQHRSDGNISRQGYNYSNPRNSHKLDRYLEGCYSSDLQEAVPGSPGRVVYSVKVVNGKKVVRILGVTPSHSYRMIDHLWNGRPGC